MTQYDLADAVVNHIEQRMASGAPDDAYIPTLTADERVALAFERNGKHVWKTINGKLTKRPAVGFTLHPDRAQYLPFSVHLLESIYRPRRYVLEVMSGIYVIKMDNMSYTPRTAKRKAPELLREWWERIMLEIDPPIALHDEIPF